MSTAAIVMMVIGLVSLALLIFLLVVFKRQRRDRVVTQRFLSDRDLLRRFEREPDGFLSPHRLSATTELTLGQARSRLTALHSSGLLNVGHNSSLRSYYRLRRPLGDDPFLTLSPDPFLTVADLLVIFEHYRYCPRDQDLIVATGLPLALIRREMKYFAREGVVEALSLSDGYGKSSQRTYVLKEPYRSQPDKFRQRAGEDDLELREILKSDNFIV